MAASDRAVKAAATAPFMANQSIMKRKARAVGSSKQEKQIRIEDSIKVGIPDLQSLALECRNMEKCWEQERVEVLGFIRSGDNNPRSDVNLLLVTVAIEIQENPDKDPAVGGLASIKLAAVKRVHQNCVVVFDEASLNGIKVLASTDVVIVLGYLPPSSMQLCQYFSRFLSPVLHFASSPCVTVQCLDLRTYRDC